MSATPVTLHIAEFFASHGLELVGELTCDRRCGAMIWQITRNALPHLTASMTTPSAYATPDQNGQAAAVERTLLAYVRALEQASGLMLRRLSVANEPRDGETEPADASVDNATLPPIVDPTPVLRALVHACPAFEPAGTRGAHILITGAAPKNPRQNRRPGDPSRASLCGGLTIFPEASDTPHGVADLTGLAQACGLPVAPLQAIVDRFVRSIELRLLGSRSPSFDFSLRLPRGSAHERVAAHAALARLLEDA